MLRFWLTDCLHYRSIRMGSIQIDPVRSEECVYTTRLRSDGNRVITWTRPNTGVVWRDLLLNDLKMASRERVCSLLLKERDKNVGRTVAMQRRMTRRRRAVLLLAMSTALALCSKLFVPNPRSVWAFFRFSDWWENIVLANFGPHDWMENFRMSRETFQYLCNQLRPVITKQNTRLRRPVSTERRVAIG